MRRLYVLLASVMMATLFIAAATGASAAEHQNHQDQLGPDPETEHQNHQDQLGTSTEIYGAIWVSPSLQSSYFASARDLSVAIERASSECEREATDCAPGVWVKNGYASFSVDVSGAWGTGWGKYASSAEAAAVAACEAGGGVACSVLQTKRTASYNPLSLTEGGIFPAPAGSGGSGAGTPR
jgi:uncharacterized protein DUF4189